MALTTYAELQAAIADWLARAGDTTITTPAPDFIKLCEASLMWGHGEPGEPDYRPPLRVRQMETRATATASSEYLALPTDYLEMRTLKVNTSPEGNLRYSTPQQFADAQSSHGTGVPVTFTIIDDAIRFGPTPSPAATVEMQYYAKIPALSVSQTTNWLLTAAPNVYLFGSLLEASAYISDDAQLMKWKMAFQGAVRGLQSQDRRGKYGPTPLIMRPVTATP